MENSSSAALPSGAHGTRRAILAGGFLLVLFLPVSLLCNLGANFYYDWHNHQWLIGYFGEYFRQHGQMPEVVHTPGAVGIPQPIFYGFLLYPCLGYVSSLVGASLAIRVGVVLALGAQLMGVYLAGRSTLRHRGVSFAVAAVVTWSVYALTNLYNRAALTEFFACTFMTTAIALGVAAASGKRDGRRWSLRMWLAGVFWILAVGSHPPTALIGSGLVIALLVTIALRGFVCREWNPAAARTLAVVVGAGIVMVGAWVYATLEFRGDLRIVGRYPRFSVSPERTDSMLARFAPFPYDPLLVTKGKFDEGTPYLEAPILVSLLVLAGWNIVLLTRNRGATSPKGPAPRSGAAWFAVVGGAWFLLTLTLSLSRTLADLFRFVAPYVQFSTRFVSHANAGLLLVVLGTGAVVSQRGGYARYRNQTHIVVAVVLTMALLAGLMKLTHAAAVMDPGGEPQYAWKGARGALVSKGNAELAGDYAAINRMPQLTPAAVKAARSVSLPVGVEGQSFGVIGEAQVELAAPGWVIVNVATFPWSRLKVNGRDLTGVPVAAQHYRVAHKLPAGAHQFQWEWRPDPVWRTLNAISRWGLIGLLAITAWWSARVAWRERTRLFERDNDDPRWEIPP